MSRIKMDFTSEEKLFLQDILPCPSASFNKQTIDLTSTAISTSIEEWEDVLNELAGIYGQEDLGNSYRNKAKKLYNKIINYYG